MFRVGSLVGVLSLATVTLAAAQPPAPTANTLSGQLNTSFPRVIRIAGTLPTPAKDPIGPPPEPPAARPPERSSTPPTSLSSRPPGTRRSVISILLRGVRLQPARPVVSALSHCAVWWD